MSKPIFLTPVFIEKIWGGHKLQSLGYDLPNKKNIGEVWAISAMPDAMSYVKNGQFQGESLAHLWTTHPELFNFPINKTFPLLTKFLDAQARLSVQVHPDDDYAREHNLASGKTECWYVLDCKPESTIIYGHNAQTRQELKQLVSKKEWSSLLKTVKIEPGDFFYIPAGKIHGVGPDTIVYELQQAADVTFRFYDYDRKGIDGKPRKLNIKESIAATMVPDHDVNVNAHDLYLADTPYFSLVKIKHQGPATTYNFPNAPWVQMTVVHGEGTVNGEPIKQGDSFILPFPTSEFNLTGDVLIMMAYQRHDDQKQS